MGKATILGDGARNLQRAQYRVKIEKDNTRVEQEFKRIDTEIAALESTIPERYTNYEDAQKAYQKARSDLDEIISQSKQSTDEDHTSRVNSATTAVTTAQTNANVAKSRYQSVRLKQRSLEGKKLYLTNNISEDIRIVWCADCQRNLSGIVATVEIPGTDDTIMIRPGGTDGSGAVYSASRDGQFRSVASMSPAEAAWNYTMFPAWQKWKPTYRLGKILERQPNNSKCTVLLDAYSTVQGLATDVERTLRNVPMYYKNQDNGGPYVVGDRVLVAFYNQNQEAPMVVGFESDPCTTSSTSTTTTTEFPLKTFYIRFTINDCTMDHSGYELELHCDDQVLYGYSHESDKELVGPFTVESCNPSVYLRNRWMYYSPWEPNTTYTIGTKIRTRRAYDTQALLHRCVQSGTSDNTEPNWPLDASQVSDGSTKWEFLGIDQTGFNFFWYFTPSDASDPDAFLASISITTDNYHGINHNRLLVKGSGSTYIKPITRVKCDYLVFDCTHYIETIDGADADVYRLDFDEIMRLKSTISGNTFHYCSLGISDPPLTPARLRNTGLTIDWPEYPENIPYGSESYPYWVPYRSTPPIPGSPTDFINISCRPTGKPSCPTEYVTGDWTAKSIDSIAVVTPGANIDYAYGILTDANGKSPSYTGLILHLGHGIAGDWYNDHIIDPGCTHDPYYDEEDVLIYLPNLATITVEMEGIPCGEFVPEAYRI